VILQINETYDENNNQWLIELEGEVDVYTVPNLKEKLNELLDKKMVDTVADCSSLQYIDSTGLGALIGIRGKMSEEGKKFSMINVRPNVKKLLNITGLDKIFIIE
jgi:anti-sigma B factor antagonist